MPYVDVWVEPEYTRKQTAALEAIVKVCRDISASGVLPTWDADALDRAVLDLLEEFPEARDRNEKPAFTADQKYHDWVLKRRRA